MTNTVKNDDPPSIQNLSDLKYLYDRVDAQIRTEFDLIGQRTTALCISQSFLVAAFVTLIRSGENDPVFQYYRAMLLPALPIIGLSISALLGVAVNAAGSVVKSSKARRERIKEKLQPKLQTSGLHEDDVLAVVPYESMQHRFGQSVALMPWIMVTFWAFTIWLLLKQPAK